MTSIAPVADGSGTRFATPTPSGGPVLTGPRVAWPERLRENGVRVRSAGVAGGARTTPLSRPGSGGLRFSAILAGSSDWLVADVNAEERFGATSYLFHSLFAGPAAGPPARRAHRCGYYTDVPLPSPVDIDGDRLIHHACSEPVVDVTNLRTGATTQVPGSHRGLRIAGSYAAWVEGSRGTPHDSVVVYDIEHEAVSYTIPARAHLGVGDLDLAKDGTLVVRYGDDELSWASPGSPVLHRIPVPGRNFTVKVAAGKVVYARGRASGGTIPRAEINVTDLAGHRRPLARGAVGGTVLPRFDFDGERVVWYAYSCKGARMHVQPIGSKPVEESLTRCPLRLRTPPKVKEGDYVVLKPSCHGYAGGCSARNVRLTARRDGHSVLVGDGRRASHVSLTAAGKELLRKRDALKVRIAATMTDGAGTRERRQGTATLMPEESV